MESNQHVQTPARKTDWHKIWDVISKILDYLLPVAISVALIVWLFNKVNFHEVMDIVRRECNFWWVIVMMAITTLSHITRGVRWGIQLRAAGVPRMTATKESVSIFGAYALNLIFPRLGEAWRCLFISRSEHVPLSTVIGTDIGDRGSDAVVVMCLTAVALIVAHPALVEFMDHYSVGRDIESVISNWILWAGIFAFITIFWIVCHYMRHYKWVRKMDGGLKMIWDGFRVLFTMKGRLAYVFLTLGIWTCYFLETYVMFQAFPFTRTLVTEPGMALGLIPGLVVFIFGSYSMAIPSNGGLGPWNLAVMFALSLYGINNTEGAAFAMVMWSCQAAWLVVLGLFSAGYIAVNRKSSPEYIYDHSHNKTDSSSASAPADSNADKSE
ncbi:MAG: flippase-like domain-containing protein [Muribaculaceae bacterium]|nr:flippase-like domain-containing protein [Muribaculaceae bacterium]